MGGNVNFAPIGKIAVFGLFRVPLLPKFVVARLNTVLNTP